MFYLAIIPSIVLFSLIWKMDKAEKEPAWLLIKLFFCGMLTIISAMLIGTAGTNLTKLVLNEESMLFILIDNFIMTALIEEGGKYFVLKKVTWKNPAFNYTFDGVVYAVMASLGFATLENILYVFEGGVGVAISRALLSVPGHVIDAIFMGSYYGAAKLVEARGDSAGCKRNLKLALIVPTLLHGFYDFSLSTPYDAFLYAFIVFEIVIVIVTIKKVKKLSKNDVAITDDGGNNMV
ncbi:MAG: PrsW family intramembrane metalloprotease [Lachnospiraceae bacterium]|nr:PrsW family intramembrane metalloprotease [Lachnospiraceae bacterium]